MSTLKIITDGDEKRSAFGRLRKWDYPHEQSKFQETVMIAIFRPKAIAYVFFEWIDEHRLLMHMGAHPDWRGKWLSRQVCMKLMVAAELLGASRVYVVTSDETVNKLCVKYGFHEAEVGYYLEIPR